MTREVVHTSPTKDFFISMITRDIALEDCILDLIDNCVDGARRALAGRPVPASGVGRFDGFRANITMTGAEFSIRDNCGGISVDQAKNYAFHFGRRKDAPEGPPETVGLYGIGMKRAMFKIGRMIMVKSSTTDESFQMAIDVDHWAADDVPWDFELETGPPTAPGTELSIVSLHDGVGEEFSDTVFEEQLQLIIARDYSVVLQEGFQVAINTKTVQPFEFGWLQSDDFEPMHVSYDDDGVTVEITAGISRVPPDEGTPGEEAEKPETKYYGWFIVCNDRVIVAGDKTELTVWGNERFPAWHPQYNGFTGTVNFRANDPKRLPWKTTKRGVDETSPLYQRAVSRMKEITRPFIAYTNARKQDLDEARRREQEAKPTSTPAPRPVMKLPTIVQPAATRARVANISYQVLEADYLRVAAALGSDRMPRKEVGQRTFAFFKERMVEEQE